MADFLRDNSESIVCTPIEPYNNGPDARWGHASAVYNDCVYIFGGRNLYDCDDLRYFNSKTMLWNKVKVGCLNNLVPPARRRHSIIFIESTVVLFGGYNDKFFNDLHILDLSI
jgi:N-acetylneuraminic acid mutarotase